MIMSRTELDTLLNTLDCQVFYNHTTTKDVVEFPYIVYTETGSNNINSDNQTFIEITPYTIIVCSDKRNDELESDLKTLLTTNKIPYAISNVQWLDDLLMWVVQFDITL